MTSENRTFSEAPELDLHAAAQARLELAQAEADHREAAFRRMSGAQQNEAADELMASRTRLVCAREELEKERRTNRVTGRDFLERLKHLWDVRAVFALSKRTKKGVS